MTVCIQTTPLDPITNMRVRVLVAECRAAYHAKNTEKCLQCSEPVAPEKDKFTGEYIELEDKGRVHAECFDEYSEATAEKCLVCKEAVRKKEGFSGYFIMFDHGKVHKVGDCMRGWARAKSQKWA